MDVRIAPCTVEDIGDVTRFIDAHWKRGHVLTSDRTLLDWQHRIDGGYAFVVARRSVDRAVVGMLGYIDTARFDPALARSNVLWLTTWKVRDDAGVAGLGLQLLQYLIRSVPHSAVGAVFPQDSTLPLYRAMGFQTGELVHYVRRRSAAAPHPSSSTPPLTGRTLVSDEDFASFAWQPGQRVPRKTVEYFRQRYARHPIYKYSVCALLDGKMPAGLVAVRLAESADLCALRLIDFAGADGLFARSASVIGDLIDRYAADYVDAYNSGLPSGHFEQAGFTPVDPDGRDIVPDNFEPFENRNVRLWWAFKGAANPTIFKGDADRDRPNRVCTSA